MINQQKERQRPGRDSVEKIFGDSYRIKLALKFSCMFVPIVALVLFIFIASTPPPATDAYNLSILLIILSMILLLYPFIPIMIARLKGRIGVNVLNAMVASFGNPDIVKNEINIELLESQTLYLTDYATGGILTNRWLIILPKIDHFGNIISLDNISVRWKLDIDGNDTSKLIIQKCEGKTLKRYQDKRLRKAKEGYVSESFRGALKFLEMLDSELKTSSKTGAKRVGVIIE